MKIWHESKEKKKQFSYACVRVRIIIALRWSISSQPMYVNTVLHFQSAYQLCTFQPTKRNWIKKIIALKKYFLVDLNNRSKKKRSTDHNIKYCMCSMKLYFLSLASKSWYIVSVKQPQCPTQDNRTIGLLSNRTNMKWKVCAYIRRAETPSLSTYCWHDICMAYRIHI